MINIILKSCLREFVAGILVIGPPFVGHNCARYKEPMTAVAVEVQSKAAEPQTINYKVRHLFTPEDKNRFSIILVSVDPKHFNSKDMVALAANLNKEFAQITKLKAALLDDDQIAQLFSTGGLEYSEFDKELRGLYYIDRTKCKEYIQFSKRKGRPKNEETINIKCSSSR